MYKRQLDGAFLKTTDGGETWMDISATITPSPPGICGLSHVGSQFVYGTGFWNYPAYFVKSTDGGNTWTNKDMSEYANALVDVHFFSPDSGFVTGLVDTLGGVVLFTANGGNTWEKVFKSNIPGEYAWKIQMLTRDTIFISLENWTISGHIACSYDGGKTWQEKAFPFNGNIQGMGFVTGKKGWVGGYFPGFWETNDGGDTWENLGVGDLVNRIFVMDTNLVYASGASAYKYTGTPIIESTKNVFESPRQDWSVIPGESGNSFRIEVNLPRQDNVMLGLFSIDGKLNRLIFRGKLPAGQHIFEEKPEVPPGVWIIGIQTNRGLEAKKITVH